MNPDQLPLREIHLPPDPSWWPLPPAWWLLPLSILLLVGLWWLWRCFARSLRRLALGELAAMEARFAAHGDVHLLAAEASALLRRVALQRKPGTKVAGLSGEAWLRFLDRDLTGKKKDTSTLRIPGRPAPLRNISQETATMLLTLPFDPHAQGDAKPLLDLCRRYCRRLPPMRCRS